MSALFAFLHHVAAFTLVSAIVVEWLLMRDEPTPLSIRRLARADAWVGMSAVAILVIGALRVTKFEKGVAFYLHSPGFYAKIGLFIVVSLLSIYPTVQFIRWNRTLREGRAITPEASTLATYARCCISNWSAWSSSCSARP